MTDLENKLRLILEEKEKLKPEIIKKDETAFGITGTYEGEGTVAPQETYNSYVFYSDEEALAYDGYKPGDKALVYKVGTAPFYPKFNLDMGMNTIYGIGSTLYTNSIEIVVGNENVVLPNQMEVDDGVSWSSTSGTKTTTKELWITLNSTECLIRTNYIHSNLNAPRTFKFTSTDGLNYTFQGVYNSDGELHTDQYLSIMATPDELQQHLLEKWDSISVMSKFLSFKQQKVLDKIYTYEPEGTQSSVYKYTLDNSVYLIDLFNSVLKPNQMWFEPMKEPYLLEDVYSLISELGFEDGTVLYTDTDIAYIFNTYNVELWIDKNEKRYVMSNFTDLVFYEYNLKTKEHKLLTRNETEYQLTGSGTIHKKCLDGDNIRAMVRCSATADSETGELSFEWYNLQIQHIDELTSAPIATDIKLRYGLLQNPSLKLDFVNSVGGA